MPTHVPAFFHNRPAWKWPVLSAAAIFLAACLLVSFSQVVPARRPLGHARYFYVVSFTRTTSCFSQVFRSACPLARLGHAAHLHAQNAGFINSRLEGPYRSPEEAVQQRAEAMAQCKQNGHYIRGGHIFADECPGPP